MSENHLHAIIKVEFVMGRWIRFWKTRNWADAIFNQFSHNFLQDPRLLIFDFGRYLTISVFITQKSKYIKYSGKIRLRINFEVEHIYWLSTCSDFLRVQKQVWSSKNPFSSRNRLTVKDKQIIIGTYKADHFLVDGTHYLIINITRPLCVMNIMVSNGKLLGKFR